MTIRLATASDLSAVFLLYEKARGFMRENGNPDQWKNTEPTRDKTEEDLALGRLFLCEENGAPIGVFCIFIGEEPAYRPLDEGPWRTGLPYGVIHRIAVSPEAVGRGVAGQCFSFALARCGDLRIDTHRDNRPMRRALAKNGFRYGGPIRLANGEERLAFRKTAGGRP